MVDYIASLLAFLFTKDKKDNSMSAATEQSLLQKIKNHLHGSEET